MTTQTLKIGQRVELHPATDAWMMGDRYGEVVKVTTYPDTSARKSYCHVKMDRSGKVRKVALDNLLRV